LRQTPEGSSVYLGEFAGGKRNGQGKQKDLECKYKGSWIQDCRSGSGILVENVTFFRFVPSFFVISRFTVQGYTFDGSWGEDKRHCTSLLTTTPLGDIRVSHWHKDVEHHGVSVFGNSILIGQKFEDGFVKGNAQQVSIFFLKADIVFYLNRFGVAGSCIMMSMNDSICLIGHIIQHSPATIEVVTSSGPRATLEWDSVGHSRASSNAPIQDPLV
jgi:hypothetical protein